jgi:diaminopimelate decarboxylase
MDEFHYSGSQLYCEECAVKALAEEFGTPAYIYSQKAFLNRFQEIQSAFSGLDPLICFSVKSNANLSLIRLLGKAGAGADIVSGGELYRSLRAGIPADKIVFAGVGKTAEEIEFALKAGIHLFNVESVQELHQINRIAGQIGKHARVGLRLNPDIDPKTHPHTTTGKAENKFGLPFQDAEAYYREAVSLEHIKVAGIDMHLGSPIETIHPYLEALNKLVPLIENLKRAGIALEEIDLGGGFSIVYGNDAPFPLQSLAAEISPIIKKTGLRLICEPGRYISGNSGILVTKVLYVKKTDLKNFIILDAGMNDLIRPAFYGSYHTVEAVERNGYQTFKADIVGPICESSDTFAKDREISVVSEGDYLAIMSAGAYCFSMSSSYNARLRPCEVLVSQDKAYVIRARETYEDLIKGE